MADLLGGGDDVVRLAGATDDPDAVWDEVGQWPRTRVTAALVAAIGVIQGNDSDRTASGSGPAHAVTGHCTGRSAAAIAEGAASGH